jgi:DUF4097 and DUF4098 domain-containing protein YvlB
MIHRTRFMLGLAVLFIVFGVTLSFTSGCTPGPTETREDSFAVAGYSRLVVSSENGSIEVKAGADNEVLVQARLKDAPRVKYELSQVGDTITVDVQISRRWWFFSTGGADITITVPPSTDVELETSNGDVELRGIEGEGSLGTSNGDVVMDTLRGDFEGRTSNGRIEGNAVEGAVVLRTSNGKVNLREVEGEFNVETSNGGIAYSGNMTAGGSNRLVTSNGSVVVEFTGNPSVVLDAETSNGDVTCVLPILATVTKDDRLVGKIGDGEADLYIRTSNGDVTIK